jgi:lysophospholipase L1-like esterase
MSLSPILSNAQRKIIALKALDFDIVDTITIEYGTNDWANGSQMDNAQDKYDTNTIGGALRYSIETLLTAFPFLKIVIVSLAWRCRTSGGVITIDSDTDTNARGNTVLEINALLKSIADEYHLAFVDVYNNTSFNRKTFLANFQDEIHPGFNGRKTMASVIAKHL